VKTGIYHKYNVMLYRTLKLLYGVYPGRLCTREIAEAFGVTPAHITDRIRDYVKYGYLKRSGVRYLDPVTGRKVKLLRLSKHGARAYIDFVNRIQHGFDLNRRADRPGKLDMYFGVKNRTVLTLDENDREHFVQERENIILELNEIVRKANLMELDSDVEQEDEYTDDISTNLVGEHDLKLPVDETND
jgi:hypothetical protein